MLFAGSRPEVQSMLGIARAKAHRSYWEPRAKYNLLSKNPPKCFYEDEPFGPFGNTFEQSESGGITNKIFDKKFD